MSPLFGSSLSERIRRSISELSPLGVSIATMPTWLATSSMDLRNAEELLPGSGLYTIPMCATFGTTSLISETHLPPSDGSNGVKPVTAPRPGEALDVMHSERIADHRENGRNVRVLGMQRGHGRVGHCEQNFRLQVD